MSGIEFSKDDVNFFRMLKDYYCDTNYPGDNFVELTKVQASEAISSTLEFQKKYEQEFSKRPEIADDLKQMDSF